MMDEVRIVSDYTFDIIDDTVYIWVKYKWQTPDGQLIDDESNYKVKTDRFIKSKIKTADIENYLKTRIPKVDYIFPDYSE